jgi:hypothetical protein
LKITKFETSHAVIEYRIKDWMERALELAGAKNVNVEIGSSLNKGAQYTEFLVSWR